MHVRVDQAGDHGAAAEIDPARRGTGEPHDLVGPAGRDDLAVGDGQRFHDAGRLQRDDLAVGQNRVGVLRPGGACDQRDQQQTAHHPHRDLPMSCRER
jgi:hypothetical protein